jgi:hypothetical protein
MGNFTQPSANRIYARDHVHVSPDGVLRVRLVITNDAGTPVDDLYVIVPVSGPIMDHRGNQLAASVPAGLNSARNSFLAALDAAIDSAAAAGRFAR